MAERWVTQIMSEAAGFDSVRIDGSHKFRGTPHDFAGLDKLKQPLSVASPDLSNLEGVRQPVVERMPRFGGRDLGYVGEALKGCAVEHAVSVPLGGAAKLPVVAVTVLRFFVEAIIERSDIVRTAQANQLLHGSAGPANKQRVWRDFE